MNEKVLFQDIELSSLKYTPKAEKTEKTEDIDFYAIKERKQETPPTEDIDKVPDQHHQVEVLSRREGRDATK